jgi:predicted flap endonuclease-1-like 5' DNA nuclease
MVKLSSAGFDEIIKLAGSFVTENQGVWDHSAWLEFLAKVQKMGVEVSNGMQSNLGELLESMKRFYQATASTAGMEKAMKTIARDSVKFIKQQQGVWGHNEWEAFAQGVRENAVSLTEEATAYLGGILESVRTFYAILPPPSSSSSAQTEKKSVAKPPAKPIKPKTVPKKAEPPKSVASDDLTVITGIGPALQKKLNQEGIYRFDQLAALTEAEIEKLEGNTIKFPGRIKREDWIGQARRLIHE